ncbi:U6 snRNA phosphodiesterase 1-like isoform X1 [Montipora capricornis]|uniref:U6 snRNA phosphodiesterase 1-like isoform X1 n=1 Tax=Montipora capricornis TaxID=246305 RepID=UPI0035F151BA
MNLDVKKDSLSQLLFSYGSDESDSSSTENEFVGEKNYNKSRSVESATKNRETDDGDKEVEGRLMLPLPEGIVNMFKEDTEYEEDPCQHDGRVRTFPHFPGNWAMQVFIPFMASAEFENLVTSLTASLSAAIFLDVYKLSHKELHVSVSRTVPIRHYWIDPIVQQLREGLSSIHRFTCALQYPELYTNDEKTRSFLALRIANECQKFQDIVRVVDGIFGQFALPAFYKDPSFHVSVAWFLGDVFSKDANDFQTNLQGVFEGKVCEKEIARSLVLQVKEVHCRIGNKLFVFSLRGT